jgi:cysteinyl-tRNA synthetase
VRNANTAIDGRDLKRAEALVAAVRELTDVVGVELRSSEAADDEIDALIARRVAARKDGDYADADRIRDELAEGGITLEDGPDGTTWHR